MKNFSINRASTPEDLALCLKMLFKYFKPYELVSSNEFVYYAENYYRLYPGEDYFVFKIESKSKEIIGMFSGVLLNEFISVDYLIIDKSFRRHSTEVLYSVLSILQDFKRPIILEAETEALVRLYKRAGFKRFSESYTYHILSVNLKAHTSEIMSHSSNLMFLSDKQLNFKIIRNTLFKKHYWRWNSIYPTDLTSDYKELLTSEMMK